MIELNYINYEDMIIIFRLHFTSEDSYVTLLYH